MNHPRLQEFADQIKKISANCRDDYTCDALDALAQRMECAARDAEVWTPVTESLLNNPPEWMREKFWAALNDGQVTSARYEWRQGRFPDRFITEAAGDIHALQATHVMPMHKPRLRLEPQPPAIAPISSNVKRKLK